MYLKGKCNYRTVNHLTFISATKEKKTVQIHVSLVHSIAGEEEKTLSNTSCPHFFQTNHYTGKCHGEKTN